MFEKIRVIKAADYNWYKVGDTFVVKDKNRYEIGVQVYKENNGRVPDVVQHGDYEYIKEEEGQS